jgi:hypothetical protein
MSNVIKYWAASLIVFVLGALSIYSEHDEFYWFYIQLMNNKFTLILLGNLTIASYFFSVYLIQLIFIGARIMEGERLVSIEPYLAYFQSI